MLKRLTLIVLFTFSMFPALANDIYIEQVGDSLDLDIVQDGQDNVIGTSTQAAILSGSGMTFSITQTGNFNTIAAQIKGVNYEGTWEFSGDSNTVGAGWLGGFPSIQSQISSTKAPKAISSPKDAP